MTEVCASRRERVGGEMEGKKEGVMAQREREREKIAENMFGSSIVAGHHYSGCLHLSWTRHPSISGTWR